IDHEYGHQVVDAAGGPADDLRDDEVSENQPRRDAHQAPPGRPELRRGDTDARGEPLDALLAAPVALRRQEEDVERDHKRREVDIEGISGDRDQGMEHEPDDEAPNLVALGEQQDDREALRDERRVDRRIFSEYPIGQSDVMRDAGIEFDRATDLRIKKVRIDLMKDPEEIHDQQ